MTGGSAVLPRLCRSLATDGVIASRAVRAERAVGYVYTVSLSKETKLRFKQVRAISVGGEILYRENRAAWLELRRTADGQIIYPTIDASLSFTSNLKSYVSLKKGDRISAGGSFEYR